MSQKETCVTLSDTVPLPQGKGTTNLVQKVICFSICLSLSVCNFYQSICLWACMLVWYGVLVIKLVHCEGWFLLICEIHALLGADNTKGKREKIQGPLFSVVFTILKLMFVLQLVMVVVSMHS